MRETEGKVLLVERLTGFSWEMIGGKGSFLDMTSLKHLLAKQRSQVGG